MKVTGGGPKGMRTGRLRLILVAIVLFAAGLGARLVHLQLVAGDELRAMVTRQHRSVERLTPRRGAILDRRGQPLALSIMGASVGLRPTAVPPEYRTQVARAVATATGVASGPISRQLRTRDRFFFAAFQTDSRAGAALAEMDLPGVEIHGDWRRVYPHRSLAAHVLGFVGTEGRGMCGLEQRYEGLLSGPERRVMVLRDGLRMRYQEKGARSEPPPSLALTLHGSLQAAVEKHLADGVGSARARGGVAIVMDPGTGEILAMASHPTFDLMDRNVRSPKRAWNRAVGMTYEPGSVMKTLALAAALEVGVVRATEIIDIGDGSLPLPGGSLREHDRRLRGRLSVTEILAESSNVGAAMVARRLTPEQLYTGLRGYGFGEETGVDLPGEEAGVLRPPSGWTERSSAMLAIGQEMSVTPLGMVVAYSALAREGRLPVPHIVRGRIDPDGARQALSVPAPRAVLSEATARTMVGMLQAVVERGTGRAARVPGYRVAGKTGTAQKPGPGGYPRGLYVSSFVGFGPVAHPRVAAIVVIDEPREGYYASEVAAPVWSRIMEDALRTFRVPPDSLLVAKAFESGSSAASPAVPAGAIPGVSTGEGRMPRLLGLGLREAVVALARHGYRVEAVGSGQVVSQSPAPGERADQGTLCRLTLGASS